LNDITKELLRGIKNFTETTEPVVKEGGTNFARVEHYGRLSLLNFFRKNGFFDIPGKKHDVESIKKKIKLSVQYERLFEIMLVILEKEGFIIRDGDTLTSTEKINSRELFGGSTDIDAFRSESIEKYEDMKCHFNLLDICISNFGTILSGEKSPDSFMFPVYSTDLVQGIFKDNMLSDYFNRLVADIAFNYTSLMRQNAMKTDVRIIEIGAGTGGTSTFVMDRIRDLPGIEYYFTDLSKIFIRGFEKKNAERYPFAKFKKLDIEKDVTEQGLSPNSFDIAIASNVIHSTKNVKNTLGNIRSLLKEDGIFLLNEVTRAQDFTTLTFGLLEGWWLFTDPEIRLPNSPLLDIAGWESVLKQSGFHDAVLASSSDKDIPDSFSQSLFIAK
jgi:SAM-dependent methyltransferase